MAKSKPCAINLVYSTYSKGANNSTVWDTDNVNLGENIRKVTMTCKT